jgi:hypothetical protein
LMSQQSMTSPPQMSRTLRVNKFGTSTDQVKI